MSLTVITGPANAGKTGQVLSRFASAHDAGERPWLVAPTRPDAARLERELVGRHGALLGARVGTLADVTAEVLSLAGALPARWVSGIEKRIVLDSLAATERLDALAASRATTGFSSALGAHVDRLGQALVEPDGLLAAIEGGGVRDPVAAEGARLYARYRAYLEREGALDAVAATARAGERLFADGAWAGAPVFMTGFDDLSAADLLVIRGLAWCADVVIALSWAAGRPAFEGLDGTATELLASADEHVAAVAEAGRYRGRALGGMEERLFEEKAGDAGPPDRDPSEPDALGILSAAGPRAEIELAASEVLRLAAGGMRPEDIALVARDLAPYRALVRQVFGSAGIPFDMEESLPLSRVPLGQALVALARFATAQDHEELLRLATSPYSGLDPTAAIAFEARVRALGLIDGRAAARLLLREIRQGRLPGATDCDLLRWLDALVKPVGTRRRRTGTAIALGLLRLLEDAARRMLVNAYGRDARRLDDAGLADAGASTAAREAIAELRRLAGSRVPMDAGTVLRALAEITVRVGDEGRPGRVQVLPVMRARGRRFDSVIVLGLNERSFPAATAEDPFMAPDTRDALFEHGVALPAPPGAAWERYLFYVAVTRARRRLALSYQHATADGAPRTPSFFLDEVEGMVGAAPRTKGLASPVFDDPGDAPGEAERRRAVVAGIVRAGHGPAGILGVEGGPAGWLADAAARTRDAAPALTGAAASALAGRTSFSATQLEKYASCPLAWFVERELRPARLDRELGALERGAAVHAALARVGPMLADERLASDEAFRAEVVRAGREAFDAAVERAAGAMEGVCVEIAWETGARWVRGLVEDQARRAVGAFEPQAFEVRFGGSAAVPALQLDERTELSGSIDRVDVTDDGRALVLDYKTGGIPKARETLGDEHLQVRLYSLAWDRLFDGRTVAGGYWSLNQREIRGAFDPSQVSPEDLQMAECATPEAGWQAALEAARERALELVEGIRQGSIAPAHDGHERRCEYCDAVGWCRAWS